MLCVIQIESSFERGMGHLYRSIDLANAFSKRGISSLFLTNPNRECSEILRLNKFSFEYIDDISNGLNKYNKKIEFIFNKYNPNLWINDRLDTDFLEVKKIKEKKCRLITFDDRGSGSVVADINFCPLIFDQNQMSTVKGKKVLSGINYIVLSANISKFYRRRVKVESILVTFGGSDTQNITTSCINFLNSLDIKTTIIIGASNRIDENELKLKDHIKVKRNVPCLYSEMYLSDLAITACGMTPFQCNATGLPCVCVAAETFEIQVGQFLSSNNGNLFLGHFSQVDWFNDFALPTDIRSASDQCYRNMILNGDENVVNAVLENIQ